MRKMLMLTSLAMAALTSAGCQQCYDSVMRFELWKSHALCCGSHCAPSLAPAYAPPAPICAPTPAYAPAPVCAPVPMAAAPVAAAPAICPPVQCCPTTTDPCADPCADAYAPGTYAPSPVITTPGPAAQ